MKDDVGLVDDQDELLHATTTHMTTTARLKCFPWWLKSSDNHEICLQLCTLTSNTLSVTVSLNINPLLIGTDPIWDSLGGCAPPQCNGCTLVIPPLEYRCNYLNLSSLASSKLGRKGFPRYGLVISLLNVPPQVLCPQ
jgi:hypothetical protein